MKIVGISEHQYRMTAKDSISDPSLVVNAVNKHEGIGNIRASIEDDCKR